MRDQSRERLRFDACESAWLRSLSLASVKCLVVCRGPVRQEAFEVFDEIGIREYGMLLSEKDSITYPRCVAPELRGLRSPQNVHRVHDYSGAGQEEKQARIAEIVEIAVSHGYTHVFAGYGFMAEDAEFIEALEAAGIGFVGPSSRVVRRAGAKDEAKKLARRLGNAVIPGVDDVSARALARRVENRKGLEKLAIHHGLDFSPDETLPLVESAEALLQLGYANAVELIDVASLQAEAQSICGEIWREHPGSRIRFKHIGGGGGKGQRVVSRLEDVSAAVMDVLAESKVLAPGSNRNFLIERNIESTRHNEIQLIGNGSWCIALGGRDCSVQMHEQKLLEISLTRELLEAEIGGAEGQAAEILRGDRATLERMESEAARFGAATGLDSVSTFECIVSGFDHYFMEMNTRIQVEHVVTELVYGLAFENPEEPGEAFVVDHLIEAMLLLAVHGARLPEPRRVPRAVSAVEVRINATNAALQPHAGGMIQSWSPPIEGEVRYDQGIGARNPDTGDFVPYKLAGAYDSNVALVVTDGASRRDSYARMAEILRRTELRGEDLQTNLSVHYGLIHWILGKAPLAKPDTRFMAAYLPAVGALARAAEDVDLEVAMTALRERQPDAGARAALACKRTLLLRPIERLLADPHKLAGFLGHFDGVLWERDEDGVHFAANPVHFLWELYHYLHLDDASGNLPCERIWDHDEEILRAAHDFYERVNELTGVAGWREVRELLEGARGERIPGVDDAHWDACQAAHRGFQVGLDLLLLLPRLGVLSGFSDIEVDDSLCVVFPRAFLDPAVAAGCVKALAPAPQAGADEIVSPMGGTFYAREAPHLPELIEVGDHFEAGQPLFIIEVMKMFNKVRAPFSGTIREKLMAGREGCVVAKGQPLFHIEPDERAVKESEATRRARMREATLALI
ncbi:MAG: biotin carboxylase [Myxococcales bacterium]|nr:biotin carboxylase [Myxococcales bacterium]MDH5565334.1 biotin carboxylase [Myxococcales bacterium]